MNTDNPIKYSDLIQPDDSIKKLIDLLDTLEKTYSTLSDDVKKNAEAIKASLQGVSGATEDGRKTIREAATETDRLTKAQKQLAEAQAENAVEIARVKQQTKAANAEAKLKAQLMTSEVGSYTNLSAQYALNKIRLNAMTEEERKAAEESEQLVSKTAALYEEMKRLQAETGKHTLNVGNYEEATVGLRAQIMELTQKLVQLRMEGKQNTEEYQQTANKAAMLKDAFTDAQKEVQNLSSDTSTLNSVLGALGAASGGIAVATGAMKLFGDESEDVQEAQKKLQAAIALTNGVTAIQNSLQKQSNLMLGIGKIQEYAKAKATALATKNTIAATVAQKAFNLVAKANPYVLLATALISVVGALIAFSRGSKEAKVSLVEQDNAIRNVNDALKEYNMQMDFAIKKAQAEGASTEELNAMRSQQAAEAQKNAAAIVNQYDAEIDAIDKTRNRRGKLGKEQQEMYDEVVKKRDEAVQAMNAANDASRKLDEEILVQKINDAKAAQESLTQMLRKGEDHRIALIANSFDRERAQRKAATKNAIADIQKQLAEDKNLTEAQRKALNEQIILLRKQLAKDLIAIDNAQQQAELQARRATEDATFALMEDGAEKKRILLATQYKREIEDIDNRLETEKGLTEAQVTELYNQRVAIGDQYKKAAKELDDEIALESLNTQKQAIELRLAAVKEGSQEEADLKLQAIEKEREIELAQNRQLAEELRQDEIAINAKYDKMAADQARQSQYDIEMAKFDEQQALQQSEINIMKTSEAKKTALRLKLEKERLQKILEMGVENGKALTDVEVETIKNAIERINQEIKSANVPQDLYDVFGLTLNDDQKAAISESMQYALDALNQWMDARVEAAEKAVAAAEKEVDAAQRTYELELQAKANGYAADVESAKKELELQKENQKKALQQQQEAQEQQQKLQTLEQIGNLVTATAKIWGTFGNPLIAIPMIAVMWASFAASKIMAKQAASEQYAEGTVELLQGGSHASGHDIDLGTKPDGTRRRAEGGEFFAVINKRNSRKFRKEIPEVIHSLNDGTFADKYLNTFNVGGVTVASADQAGVDLMPLSDDVRAIREQNAKRYIVLADGTMVEMYKNLTRRVVQ